MVISAKAKSTAKRYYGATASEYEANRIGQPKWDGEDRAVKEFLEPYGPGTRVLDIPCGTGRFFDFYREKRFAAVGIDISKEMIAIAQAKELVPCRVGSIFDIELPDNSVDVAIAIRFMNLIEASDMAIALRELQRVAKERVAFTLRVGGERKGHYHSARSMDDIVLAPGWRIEANHRIHQDTYRLIVLCAG